MNAGAGLHDLAMSDRDFKRFSTLIYEQCGINLVPAKKTMLTLRLRKRLRDLGLDCFGKYYDFVSGSKGQDREMIRMLDAVSTNKTDFFRESGHFDYLLNEALPFMVRSGRWHPGRKLNIWSAGCASGEEPYTIAMVLAKYMSENRTGDFSILASDISTRVLETARKGIYPEAALETMAPGLKREFFMRGKGSQRGFHRVVPELRRRVQFQRLNLNGGKGFGLKTRMDVIFCRNVIIYFDRETQRRLFAKFHEQLEPGGYLFIGHSETLNGINDRFKAVSNAVYRKQDAA